MAVTEKKNAPGKPKVNIRFIFNVCNDVENMRHFYTDLIGLQQGSFRNDKDWGWLVYKSDGFEMMFFRADRKLQVHEEWAAQPGYEGGTLEVTSWGIHIPEAMFAEVVERVRSAGVKVFKNKPDWPQDCYWGFTVMDPMGNTVELYAEPQEKPTSTEWPDIWCLCRGAGKLKLEIGKSSLNRHRSATLSSRAERNRAIPDGARHI